MSISCAVLVLLLSGVGLAGCGKDEKGAEAPAPAGGTPPATAAPNPAAPVTPAAGAKPGPVGLVAPPVLPPAGGPVTSVTPDIPPDGSANAEAVKFLSDAQTDIAHRNWESAETVFKKLNAMKGQLSPEMKKAIDKAQANFTTARNASRLPLSAPATNESNGIPNK